MRETGFCSTQFTAGVERSFLNSSSSSVSPDAVEKKRPSPSSPPRAANPIICSSNGGGVVDSGSPTSKTERKVIEKNRRMRMKLLITRLASLIPPDAAGIKDYGHPHIPMGMGMGNLDQHLSEKEKQRDLVPIERFFFDAFSWCVDDSVFDAAKMELVSFSMDLFDSNYLQDNVSAQRGVTGGKGEASGGSKIDPSSQRFKHAL